MAPDTFSGGIGGGGATGAALLFCAAFFANLGRTFASGNAMLLTNSYATVETTIAAASSTIGVLGGMGPESSVQLYAKLVERSYKHFGSNLNDYPKIVINNVPVPNLFQRSPEEMSPYLSREAVRLAFAGAGVIGICCNTAHYYFNAIRTSLPPGVELINLIDSVRDFAVSIGGNRAGIVCTSVSRRLYKESFAKRGRSVDFPDQDTQAELDRLIESILAGRRSAEMTASLHHICASLHKRGASPIILGCTDLPLIWNDLLESMPVYSSTEILAEALFEAHLKRRQE